MININVGQPQLELEKPKIIIPVKEVLTKLIPYIVAIILIIFVIIYLSKKG